MRNSKNSSSNRGSSGGRGSGGSLKERVAITGGNGFIGRVVVQELLEAGRKVHLLSSRGKAFISPGQNLQLFHASILDREQKELIRFMRGCDTLFHLAGMVSRRPEDAAKMMQLHLEGTRNLLAAAAKAQIRRVILMSTSGVTGIASHTEPATDSSPYAMEPALRWPYYASKIFQEKLARNWAMENARQLIALRPSLALGPGDQELSSTQDILHIMQGRIPAIPRGGLSFVDVRDISRACLTILDLEDQQLPQELQREYFRSYLLGGANMSFRQFAGRVAALGNRAPPRFSPPAEMQQLGARFWELTGKKGRKWIELDSTAVEMANFFWYIDSARAKEELNWQPRPAEQTLKDTIHSLQKMAL